MNHPVFIGMLIGAGALIVLLLFVVGLISCVLFVKNHRVDAKKLVKLLPISKREQKRLALEQLQRKFTALKLLLQGTTEEQELARREQYLQLLLPLPPLEVPSANLPWYRELMAIVTCLNQLGSPAQSKRITLGDIRFYAEMFDQLEMRFKLQIAETTGEKQEPQSNQGEAVEK